MAKEAQQRDMDVVRIELPGEKGIRPARNGDGILTPEGTCIVGKFPFFISAGIGDGVALKQDHISLGKEILDPFRRKSLST